jgi:hypothetical protein
MNMGWRRQPDKVVLSLVSNHDALPVGIVKVALLPATATRIAHEAAILLKLGAPVRSAKAQIPQPGHIHLTNGSIIFTQTAMRGQPAAVWLACRPERLSALMGQIILWLERWNCGTCEVKSLDRICLNKELIAPAALLAPHLAQGKEYLAWLAARCHSIMNTKVPFVAVHNDLTMRNILLDRSGQMSIVDWESGREDGFPLVDFFYAMIDAVATISVGKDRLVAFEACFSPNGAYTRLVAGWQERLTRVLGISPEFAELCVHACWLHHAVNEKAATIPAEPRPFFQIVQRMALRRPIMSRRMTYDG